MATMEIAHEEVKSYRSDIRTIFSGLGVGMVEGKAGCPNEENWQGSQFSLR
jgi:hypothetical protein